MWLLMVSIYPVWPEARVKSLPIFPISCPKSRHSSLTYKIRFYKIAQKVAKYVVYFGKEICRQEVPKIAQSGHTEVGS